MTAHISDTVEMLAELIHGNVANEGRLRDAAKVADEPMNQQLLRYMADQRSELADELQAHAASFGRVPDAEPTLVDKFSRTVTKIRGVVTSDQTEMLLEKAAECEVDLRDEYRKALSDEHVALSVKDVLNRQLAETGDYSVMIQKIEKDERIIRASRVHSQQSG